MEIIKSHHPTLIKQIIIKESPTSISIEINIHKCPSSLISTTFLPLFFPDSSLSKNHSNPQNYQSKKKELQNELKLIICWQKTKNDMSSYSDQVQEERDKYTQIFVDWAKGICEKIKTQNHWMDFIDPSSGKPFLGGHVNSTWDDTDDSIQLLGYEILELGCCRIATHEKFKTFAVLSLIATTAPLDLIEKALQ